MHAARRTFGLVAVAAAAAVGVAACGTTSPSSGGGSSTATTPSGGGKTAAGGQWTTSHPFKVGFIYVGAPSDAGWTHAHEVGRLAVQKAFGGRVVTFYKQNVPEGPQVATTITQLVNQGAGLIFSTSLGFEPYLVQAAAKYPNVKFEQATGEAQSANLVEYYGAGETGDYLSGMAAGAASTNGNIGFVAPFSTPEVIREIDAYTMGAQATHPGATVRVVWTNTWFSPQIERSAAESLVAQGVTAIGDGQDSPTTGQVAEQAGIPWTGYDSNQQSFAPKVWLTATTYNWAPYYTREVKAAMDGTWTGNRFYYGTLADHFVVMAPFGTRVSAKTRAAILAKEKAIADGTFNPFTGPIYKQDGTLGVPAGTTLPVWKPNTLSLYSLNWFVKGVIGNVKG